MPGTLKVLRHSADLTRSSFVRELDSRLQAKCAAVDNRREIMRRFKAYPSADYPS